MVRWRELLDGLKGGSSTVTLLTGACSWIGLGVKMLQVSFSRPKSLSCGARVFRHPQVIEDQADVARELPHFLGDAACTCGFDEGNGKTA
jgi:hypothetical protein